MNERDFWDRVKHGADLLGIRIDTVAVWKHRGRVAKSRHLDLFEVLAGTENEISSEELRTKH